MSGVTFSLQALVGPFIGVGACELSDSWVLEDSGAQGI